MRDPLAILFMGAVAAGFVSWFFTVAEFVATLILSRWAFVIGPRVYEAMWPEIDWHRLGSKGVVGELRYRSLPDGRLLVRATMPLFQFRARSFPLKVTVQQTQEGVRVTARAPLGPQMFFSAWLVGWTVGALGIALKGAWPVGLGMFVLGAAFAGGIWYATNQLGRSRFVESLAVLRHR